jgi:hypothetical protein
MQVSVTTSFSVRDIAADIRRWQRTTAARCVRSVAVYVLASERADGQSECAWLIAIDGLTGLFTAVNEGATNGSFGR